MIIVLAGTAWILVRDGLATRAVLGFALPPREFARQALVGLFWGLVLMLIMLAPLFALKVRVWNQHLPDSVPAMLALSFKAVTTGITVALVEETFFRGAVQGSMSRFGAVRAAILLVPLIYSAIHFFGEAARVPFDQVTSASGFTILAGFLRKFAYPKQIVDAFVALYFIGVLLALVRHYTGNIAGCIGLHAGIAAVISVIRSISAPGPDSPWMLLVGRFDHLLGIWAAIVGLVACWVYWSLATRGTIASRAKAWSTAQ